MGFQYYNVNVKQNNEIYRFMFWMVNFMFWTVKDYVNFEKIAFLRERLTGIILSWI